ncbi:MAG: 30S ribosomal protein S16 [Planctomycetota bacterium]
MGYPEPPKAVQKEKRRNHVRTFASQADRSSQPRLLPDRLHHTTRRDGKPVEDLGWYDPVSADDARRYLINLERAEYWLAQGALPSETVRSLIKRARRENQDQ